MLHPSEVIKVIKWFKARFDKYPNQDIAYFEEWLYRFSKGFEEAEKYMDTESKKIWDKLSFEAGD